MGKRLQNAKNLYIEGIRDGHPVEAIHKYTGDRYTQHSTPVTDGREGFIEFFNDFIERNPVREIEIVRGFEDGRHVFVHAFQNLNHGEYRYVTADIFDTDEQGKIIEHWDVIAEVSDESVSGRTQIDGPTEPTDLEKTEDNKRLVGEFLTEVLQGGRFDRLADYVSTESYAQHNPQIDDGLAGWEAFTKDLAAQGRSMRYVETHRLIGCGNFVAALSEVDLGGTAFAVIDLFRVADDRIVEHWDVMEEIPPRDQWVNSGKF